LAHYPHRIHDLTSRQFEELVADILKDFGFNVELTRATRDGGKDILAYISNQITSFLTFVECKKYAPHQKVGVDVVRQVYGVQRIYHAHKSLIVTTSTFTAPAIAEQKRIENEMSLKDYENIAQWLQLYQQPKAIIIVP
jgi:restriction endonuclease Mrr